MSRDLKKFREQAKCLPGGRALMTKGTQTGRLRGENMLSSLKELETRRPIWLNWNKRKNGVAEDGERCQWLKSHVG